MEEIWRDIKGYENRYQISSLGRIKSLVSKKILKFDHRKGYNTITFSDRKHHYVHRLLALAFPEICGEYFEGAVINHKNEIVNDNRPENLEWCTVAYNNHYGTREHLKEVEVWQYSLDNIFIKEWNSLSQIERETEFKFRNIQTCCSGKSKTAYGYIWRYKPFFFETSQELVGRLGKMKAA